MEWITPITITAPPELNKAEHANRRRMDIIRYRSRTEVTDAHINTAYNWLRLPVIIDNELDPNNANQTASALYRTSPITRGVSEEEAYNTFTNTVQSILGCSYTFNIMMFNTGTAAAATVYIKHKLDEDTEWNAIDVSALVTSAANHKVYMYKRVTAYTTNYIILNNLDTPSVVFKLAAAIMLDQNTFNEHTQEFAEAWMSGNGDTVCNLIRNYYKDIKAIQRQKQRTESIENLCKAITVDRSSEFEYRMNDINDRIQSLISEINRQAQELNKIKGEYLLYTLEDSSEKLNELKTFFGSCDNRLSYLKFEENSFYIVYHTKLMYFEPQLLKRYFESTRGNCVTNAPAYYQQLLKDIFIDNKYYLHIESGAAINTTANNVRYADPMNFINDVTYPDFQGIPNPHHKYYNCWGDNLPNITRALVDKDYITAISTIFAAISGLNISDTAVMEKFICRELNDYQNVNCLESKETGEMISISTYIRRYEDASDEANQ